MLLRMVGEYGTRTRHENIEGKGENVSHVRFRLSHTGSEEKHKICSSQSTDQSTIAIDSLNLFQTTKVTFCPN